MHMVERMSALKTCMNLTHSSKCEVEFATYLIFFGGCLTGAIMEWPI